MNKFYRRLLRISFLVMILVGMFMNPSPAHAATYTVNSLGDLDDGSCNATHCSLREAINAANDNPGPDTIGFNLGGSPPYILVLDSPLYLIDDGTTIDGTTEPNYSGAPVVVLESGDPSTAPTAIHIGSSNNVVRGLSIVGFDAPFSGSSHGIMIWDGDGNLIEQNYIGLYPSGTANGNNAGVRIVSQQPQSVLNNVISGNNMGIHLYSGGHAVHGNIIGLDPTGTTAVMNWVGVKVHEVYGTAPVVIGGLNPGQGNVISGNSLGVQLVDVSDVIVQGNYIGTDTSGTSAVGNTIGVQLIGTSGVVIGGGNVISGNHTDGIQIFLDSSGNQVINNVIGLDVNGSPLGNGHSGVVVGGDNNNQIGGPGQGNVISANLFGGIVISGGSNHQIIGNIIGEDGNGNPAGNIGSGISIHTDNVVVSQNVVAFNGGMGIHMAESNNNLISENEIHQNIWQGVNIFSGTGNTISQNSMYANGNIGINLYSPGEIPFYITLNDNGDPDSGPNTLLNYPVFTSINPLAAEGIACVGCIVELFLPDGDPSGHGEGEVFLGSDIATGGIFSVDTSGYGLPPCTEVTATATDASGNTSEFSPNNEPKMLAIACLTVEKIPPLIFVLVPGIVVGGWTYYRRRKPRAAVGGFLVGAVFGVAILLVGNALTRTTPAETGTEGQEPSPMIEQVEPDKDTPVPTPTPTPSPKLYCEGVLGVSLLDDGWMRTSVRVMGVTGSFEATLNTQDIICQSYDEYPDTLFCDSPRPEPGSWATLTIFDPEGNAFCEETFSAPSRTIEEDLTCKPPPGGCGNPKQGYYWDGKACKCNQCPTGGVYDENQGKCVKP